MQRVPAGAPASTPPNDPVLNLRRIATKRQASVAGWRRPFDGRSVAKYTTGGSHRFAMPGHSARWRSPRPAGHTVSDDEDGAAIGCNGSLASLQRMEATLGRGATGLFAGRARTRTRTLLAARTGSSATPEKAMSRHSRPVLRERASRLFHAPGGPLLGGGRRVLRRQPTALAILFVRLTQPAGEVTIEVSPIKESQVMHV